VSNVHTLNTTGCYTKHEWAVGTMPAAFLSTRMRCLKIQKSPYPCCKEIRLHCPCAHYTHTTLLCCCCCCYLGLISPDHCPTMQDLHNYQTHHSGSPPCCPATAVGPH
jgi:hypothetical protein